MNLQIPGPGTHPHDYMPDQRAPKHDYMPHGSAPPRYKRTGRAHGRPKIHTGPMMCRVAGLHPRAEYWRNYKRKSKAMAARAGTGLRDAEGANP